jgi:hypothetical protein
VIGGVIGQHEAILLTIGGMWELDETASEQDEQSVRPEVIQRHLKRVVAASAGSRDMSRFDPSVSS